MRSFVLRLLCPTPPLSNAPFVQRPLDERVMTLPSIIPIQYQGCSRTVGASEAVDDPLQKTSSVIRVWTVWPPFCGQTTTRHPTPLPASQCTRISVWCTLSLSNSFGPDTVPLYNDGLLSRHIALGNPSRLRSVTIWPTSDREIRVSDQ